MQLLGYSALLQNNQAYNKKIEDGGFRSLVFEFELNMIV